jgi:hypothetical protein
MILDPHLHEGDIHLPSAWDVRNRLGDSVDYCFAGPPEVQWSQVGREK